MTIYLLNFNKTKCCCSHQLHLGVESIRAPEILFQPSMIGSPEAGIAETIDFVLKQFSPDEQMLLVQNIYLTGGCSNFNGENTIYHFFKNIENIDFVLF